MSEKQTIKVMIFIILALMGLAVLFLFFNVIYKEGIVPPVGQIKTVLG